jgi:hypothetical protein
MSMLKVARLCYLLLAVQIVVAAKIDDFELISQFNCFIHLWFDRKLSISN